MSAASDCLVDLGHTRIKWASVRQQRVLPDTAGASRLDDLGSFERFLAAHRGQRVWLSGQSNAETVANLVQRIDHHGLSFHRVFTGEFDLPVQPAYPALGSDRWLALQWPWLETRQACCVIDCGTAVTIDLIDDHGQHRGGWIMAGLNTLRDGLLEKARGLPRSPVAASQPFEPARDSALAISAGTLLQLVGAIDRAVVAARQALGMPPSVWLTGGDAAAIVDRLAVRPRLDELLVLRGLALTVEAQ